MRRPNAQARPGGKGSGKVTAGHGRTPRRDTRRGGSDGRGPDVRRSAASGGPARRSPSRPEARNRQEQQRTRREDAKRGSDLRERTAVDDRAASLEGVAAESAGEQAAETPAEGAAVRASEGMASTRVRDRRRLSEKMGRSTRVRLWLQSSALDFLLVAVVSVALTYTVSYGFYSAEAYRGNVFLLAALEVPLLLVLFAGSWSKRAVPLSALGAVVLSGVYIGAATAVSPDPALFAEGGVNDVAGNYTIFALVVCVTTAVTYLLSRRTAGLVFLLVFGVLACGIVQFLWREWIPDLAGIPSFIAVFLGIGMLFVYQCYRQSVYSANRVKRTSFSGAFAYSALIGVVCVAMGAGVFALVGAVAPDTIAFKPFESHVSPPVDELAQAYEKQDSKDDDKTNQTNDDEQETSESDEGGNDARAGGFGILEGSFVQAAAQQMAGYDPNNPDQEIDNIAYLVLTWEAVILAMLIFLVVLAVVSFWRYRRTLRLKRIERKSPSYQAWYLYTFLVERFRRLKLAKPEQLTPLEFAVGFSKPMLPFTRGTDGVDFVDVSSIYQDAAFGGMQPTVEELFQLKAYYRAFFKNARQYVGWPKWVLWKFWRV